MSIPLQVVLVGAHERFEGLRRAVAATETPVEVRLHLERVDDGDALWSRTTLDRVDVLVLDLDRPDTGLDAVERVRARWPDAPLVAHTRDDGLGRALAAVGDGVDELVVTDALEAGPLVRAVLLAVLRRSLHAADGPGALLDASRLA